MTRLDDKAVAESQDPRVVVSTLMKLAGGSPSLSKELNVDAFLEQASLLLLLLTHSISSCCM